MWRDYFLLNIIYTHSFQVNKIDNSIINIWKEIHIHTHNANFFQCFLYHRVRYFHKKFRIFLESAVGKVCGRCANCEFIFGGNPTWCETASDQLEKRAVSVAWNFQGHKESFPGPLYRMSCRVFENFVKIWDSCADSLCGGNVTCHYGTQRLVIASTCPLTGLVKSKNNIARAYRARRCKWTQQCKSDVLSSLNLRSSVWRNTALYRWVQIIPRVIAEINTIEYTAHRYDELLEGDVYSTSRRFRAPTNY